MIFADMVDVEALHRSAETLLDEGATIDDTIDVIANTIDDLLVWSMVPLPALALFLETVDGTVLRQLAKAIVTQADRARSRPQSRKSLVARVLAEVRGKGGQQDLRRKVQRLRADRDQLSRDLTEARDVIRRLKGEGRTILTAGPIGGQG